MILDRVPLDRRLGYSHGFVIEEVGRWMQEAGESELIPSLRALYERGSSRNTDPPLIVAMLQALRRISQGASSKLCDVGLIRDPIFRSGKCLMATAAKKPIKPLDGARRVIETIRVLLPRDARWDVDLWDEDGLYHLNVFADIVD